MNSSKPNFLTVGLFILLLSFLSACGGGGSATNSPAAKEKAIKKITAYSQDQNKTAPSLQDYTDAGVTGVTSEILDALNSLVAGLTADEVDTTAELNTLISQLGINIKPIANAGGNKAVQVNNTVTISGTGTDEDGTIASVKWEKDGVVISTNASFNYTPISVGTDTLTFTVTDNDDDSDSESIVVTVSAEPPPENQAPTADAGINKTVQVYNPIRITGVANDNDGTTSVEWKKGSTVISTNESFVYTPTHVGTDTLDFIVTDDDGASASDSMSVVVTAAPLPNQAPSANAGSDQTIEVNKSITITGSGSDIDGTISYQWKKGSTVLSNNASFPYTPTAVGTDVLTLTVTDDDGAFTSDSMNLVVTEAPAENEAPTANAGPDKTVQVNIAIAITGSGTDGDGTIASYKWEKGGAVINNSASFNYTPTTVGTDILTLTVTDDDGATATDTMEVVVTGVPVDTTPPVINRIGASSIDVFVGDIYTDAGATATDNNDGNITANIVTKVNNVLGNTIDTNVASGTTYTFTYNVSDAAGNPAAQVTRTVNIIDDSVAPIILRVGAQYVDVTQGSTYTDAGATATDNKDGTITASIVTRVDGVIGGTVDTSVATNTIYTITYDVSDAAGNNAITVERFVKIVEANSIPAISSALRDSYLLAINNARGVGRNCGSTFYPAVPDVTWNDNLYKAAYEHSQDMSESDISATNSADSYFSHNGSGTVNDWTGYSSNPSHESTVVERLATYGLVYGTNLVSYSENITAGTNRNTVQLAMASWLNSPGHCINIMSSSVDEVGLAHTSNAGAYYTNYWTQNFGKL